ncbi:MAG: MotA/TolQ/ExbB proton channel family protein [Anaerovoracaceae bacterium]
MLGPINLTETLRAVAGNLQTPVVFMLLLLIAITIVLLGFWVGEFFTQRIYIKVKDRTIPDLIEELQRGEVPMAETIAKTGLLKRQKNALLEVMGHPDITDLKRESLAVRLIEQEKANYDRRTKITDTIAKAGPVLGLMGTLIPLGPGIIALGQGDTFTLSNSLLVAFDTTIAGLLCALVALVISTVRKVWYRKDMSILETLMECVLEEENRND